MFKLLTVIANWIFPESKEASLLKENQTDIKELYRGHYINNVIFLSNYKNPLIKAAIKENKFHNNQTATNLLARLLESWLKDQPNNLVFIPIPLSKKRQRMRGYNQVTKVLTGTKYSLSINEDILIRKSDTKPQSGLTKTDREQNVKNCFICKNKKLNELKDVTIVIVDDVITTGATMNEARATLAPHLPSSVKLICLSIAH